MSKSSTKKGFQSVFFLLFLLSRIFAIQFSYVLENYSNRESAQANVNSISFGFSTEYNNQVKLVRFSCSTFNVGGKIEKKCFLKTRKSQIEK